MEVDTLRAKQKTLYLMSEQLTLSLIPCTCWLNCLQEVPSYLIDPSNRRVLAPLRNLSSAAPIRHA